MLDEAANLIRTVGAEAGATVVGVGRRGPRGSGLVITPGRVLTNAHNLRDRQVRVSFADGRADVGEVLSRDVDADLAVIEVDTVEVEPIEWVDHSLEMGAPVVALANPGGRGLRVTLGFVSGTDRRFRGPRGRRIGGAIEHTAPLLPGSSGGPLVDADGKLAGINTHRLGDGFYLALPAGDALRTRVDALLGGDEPRRFRLGIAVVPGPVSRSMRRAVGLADTPGVLIRHVEPESPAATAGLAAGDLIVAIGDTSIADLDELFAFLDGVAEGDELTIRYLRGAEDSTTTVLVP